jgi:multidrug efflux pump subunit AcrB
MRQLPTPAGGILSYFTRHRTAANLVLILMVVSGALAMTQIRAQFFPDIITDNINVSVVWDGAGPEDVDGAIVALLEPALLAVEGIEESSASSTEGRARISLEFEPGWDMGQAADDVKTAVDGVTGLPEGAEAPEVTRGRWRDRVTDVVISGPVSPDQLGRFADEFSARLFREGITRVTIRGIGAPDINVTASEFSLIRNDVALSEIADAIEQEAEADPAGDVAGGSARIRTGVAKRTPEQIERIVVRSNPDGSKLLVGDVAEVSVEAVNADRTYYVGDNQAVSIRVDRADQGDAIKMQATVQRVADEMHATLPQGVKVELIRTRAQDITDRLDILVDNGILGLMLVVILLFLFLNARTAFWVAAGIPASMLAAIGLMFLMGLTLNMVSLFGLIITLGIVVDDAIVVGEHADFRARRLGEGPVEAAENAAIRMAPPVFSATVTTVIAFFSLTAIGGRFGTLIIDIPMAVILVLVASLIECFIVLPNHMGHALSTAGQGKWYDRPSHIFNIGFKWVRHNLFRPAITWVLVLRYPVVAATVLALSLAVTLFVKGDVQWRFFNSPEQASVSGNIAMLSGATRDDTLAMVRELQRAVTVTADKFEAEYGVDPVIFTLAEVGGNTGRGLAGAESKDADLLGSIAVELVDADSRPYSSAAFVSELQDAVRRHPLLETVSFRGFHFGPGGDALDVQFFGADSEVLKAAAEDLKSAVSVYPEVSAVEDNLAYDKDELVLELTPQGRALGFTIDEIGRELRNRLGGITAASFPVGVRSADVTVRMPDEDIGSDFLETTRLRTEAGIYVPLSDVVTVSTKAGFSTVRRENGLRVLSVTGDIAEDDPDRAALIMTDLEQKILPAIAADHGVEWRLSGLAEQERDFLADASVGFGICLLGIYLTLTWIFGSWTRPVIVMAVIPFGLVGAIYGHWVWEVPLSMFSVVGIIGMSGIIINDSIVLVTTVDEYSKTRGLVPAIVDATCDRLRPVILTTLTTVLGMLPLLFESSRQAQFLKPTVITLVYGLGFGVLLVLLLVPSLLVIQQDLSKLFSSYRRGLLGARVPRRDRAVFVGATFAALGLLVATLGYQVVTQSVAPWVAGLTGALAAQSPTLASLAVLVAGLFAVMVCGTVAAFLLHRTQEDSKA